MTKRIGAGDASYSWRRPNEDSRYGRAGTVTAVGFDAQDRRVILLSGHAGLPWNNNEKVQRKYSFHGAKYNTIRVQNVPHTYNVYGHVAAGCLGSAHDWSVARLHGTHYDTFHPSSRLKGLVRRFKQTPSKKLRLQFWSRFPKRGMQYGRIVAFGDTVSFSLPDKSTVKLTGAYRVRRTNDRGQAISGRFSIPGDSGGLVCTASGEAIGLVVASNLTRSWVLPIAPVAKALNDLGFRFFL